jgi:hypothetical protein
MNLLFSFQDTYNSRLKERYDDDPSTHPDIDPDLWLETWSSNRPNRNQMHALFNTTNENLQTTRNASTIGCSQSILSIQTSKFVAMLNRRVQDQTTHFNDKYEQLTSYYEKLPSPVSNWIMWKLPRGDTIDLIGQKTIWKTSKNVVSLWKISR